MAATEAARRARTVAAACAFCVTAVACIVLLGWVLDVPNMKGMFGTITMKTNAAIGLLLCALGVWAHSRGYRRLGACSGAAAAIIGALTLSQHLFGWNLGIDELLFREPAGAAATASPNRMGPNASSSLVLAGTALVLLSCGSAAAVRYAQTFATTAVCLATLAVAGYIYGAAELYAVARYTGIALHTAVALIVLNVGVAATRIEEGPLAVFVTEGPAGTLLRRLAGPVVVLPLALGYVTLEGRELGLYDRGLSLALFAVLLIIIFAAVVWRTAATIAAADASRRAAEQDRDDLLVREREARAAAERASRLKDQFIAVLSHELRTPLNVMLGWTHVLETERSFERHARAAGIVARNGRMLARLVEDLLDVSRVSAGQFEIARRPVAFKCDRPDRRRRADAARARERACAHIAARRANHHRGRGPGAAAAGCFESVVQRHQVHFRGRPCRRCDCPRRRSARSDRRGRRHRIRRELRHPALSAVSPGRFVVQARIRRPGIGTVDRQAHRGAARRVDSRGKCRSRQGRHLHAVVARRLRLAVGIQRPGRVDRHVRGS
jgi:signal transduction histidine kinase